MWKAGQSGVFVLAHDWCLSPAPGPCR